MAFDGTLYYFSGTGNSYRVARWAQATLAAAGHTITLRPVELAISNTDSVSDLIGLCFPVYAYGLPRIVDEFLRYLPPGHGRPVFCLSTHGDKTHIPGFAGNAPRDAAHRLSERGYRVLGAASIGMPVSMTVAVGPPPEERIADILTRAEQRTRTLVSSFTHTDLPVSQPPVVIRSLCRLIQRGFFFLLRRKPGTWFSATDDCIRCGRCVQLCPRNGIEMTVTVPRWTGPCELCHRCINTCPTQAIQGRWGTRGRRRYLDPCFAEYVQASELNVAGE